MALDFDTPRTDPADADPIESLEALAPARNSLADILEDDDPETLDLGGLDPVMEELQIHVVPPRRDEFTCQSCFMIKHRAQRAAGGSCHECTD